MCELGRRDRFARRVGTSPGDYRHTTIGTRDRRTHHIHVFFVIERWRFTRRAHGDESVDSSFDLEFDKFIQIVEVNFLLCKGRHKSREGAS